jgi:hypothetical protein
MEIKMLRISTRYVLWVSTVSDYKLDDQGSIPGRGNGFSSSLYVQTRSEAHPAS